MKITDTGIAASNARYGHDTAIYPAKPRHGDDTAISAPSVARGEVPVAAADEDTVYRAKVQQAAEKFESFFISQMLRQMRSATREIAGEGSIYDKNSHTDMLDFADTAFADAMAQQRSFGIADVIVRQLLPVNNK